MADPVLQFEVETGSASATGTSYASVTQFKQYCVNYNIDYSDVSDTDIEIYLNKATRYLDHTYNFMGLRRLVRTQALEWPRILTRPFGRVWEFLAFRYVQSTEIPKEIIEATCLLATIQKAEGTLGLDVYDRAETSVSIGPVSIAYNRNKGFIRYPEVERILKYLITETVESKRVR